MATGYQSCLSDLFYLQVGTDWERVRREVFQIQDGSWGTREKGVSRSPEMGNRGKVHRWRRYFCGKRRKVGI